MQSKRTDYGLLHRQCMLTSMGLSSYLGASRVRATPELCRWAVASAWNLRLLAAVLFAPACCHHVTVMTTSPLLLCCL